ncbi:hypothetical protein IMZ48_21090 [Candidatus Bathyarchaeota archaeon]|nr:hypothetical protein [Candidatus Bathyarchaeota archaeon]
MPVKCTRLKADGSPCLAPAMKNADVCFFHATNDDVKAAVKKQDEALDIAAELKLQLRNVKKARANSLEKAKLILEIVKALKDLEGKGQGETETEEKKKPTPREILLGKK